MTRFLSAQEIGQRAIIDSHALRHLAVWAYLGITTLVMLLDVCFPAWITKMSSVLVMGAHLIMVLVSWAFMSQLSRRAVAWNSKAQHELNRHKQLRYLDEGSFSHQGSWIMFTVAMIHMALLLLIVLLNVPTLTRFALVWVTSDVIWVLFLGLVLTCLNIALSYYCLSGQIWVDLD